MTRSSDAGVVLALVGGQATAALERAAAETGLGLVMATGLQDLLAHLAARAWAATVLSLAAEHVDEPIVLRVGQEPRKGALILTAPAVSMNRALLMERAGASALIREPLDPDEVGAALLRARDEGAVVPLQRSAADDGSGGAPTLIGDSPAMGRVFETAARVARSTATVLVTGESGTGKEVVARTLHAASDRSAGPFVAVNCAAIPEHLLESELFGHEKGAFTGAVARRMGRFERADGGTLFLDEIGDMSLVLQAKVLRALEERAIERVGGGSGMPIDVRVVAATNHDLEIAMQEGRFREDLFYRLAVVQIHLPPLRERGSDLRSLALHFAAHFANRYDKPVTSITERALERLADARWPGNVRELRNVMDRAVLLAHGSTIRTGDLRVGAGAPRASAHGAPGEAAGYAATMSLAEVESDHIRRVLDSVDGHMGRAAGVLGIHRNTLTRKLKEYGIADSAAPVAAR